MAELGPHAPGRHVAVACSGGADSTALALLAARWGRAQAFIVNHGLRPEAVREAAACQKVLAAMGTPAEVLTLQGLHPGPGLAARARTARYAALEQACDRAGLADLLLGHHADDQAETVAIRMRAGSGPGGLAGMARVVIRGRTRLLRPLLSLPATRLRATLSAAGVAWVEDPSNRNPAWERVRVRDALRAQPWQNSRLLVTAQEHAEWRAAQETDAAEDLARYTELRPEGFAVIHADRLHPMGLGALLATVAGQDYRPQPARVAALARALRPATLGGTRLLPGGRLGTWLLVREPAAMAAAVPARPGAVWDGRFRMLRQGTGGNAEMLGPAGPAASRQVFAHLPAAVRATLPALWSGGMARQVGLGDCLLFAPPAPATAAPFPGTCNLSRP
jgi:tRNA(Ile)-lysidine synthase